MTCEFMKITKNYTELIVKDIQGLIKEGSFDNSLENNITYKLNDLVKHCAEIAESKGKKAMTEGKYDAATACYEVCADIYDVILN